MSSKTFLKKKFLQLIHGNNFSSDQNFPELFDYLFARVPTEDLAHYDKAVLEKAASLAEKGLVAHKRGLRTIHIDSAPDLLRDGKLITVVSLINDNMPFLFDSILSEINQNVGYPFLVTHPVLVVRYDDKGYIEKIDKDKVHSVQDKVSLIQIHLLYLDEKKKEHLNITLAKLVERIHLVVKDWKPMLKRLDQAIEQLQNFPIPFAKDSVHEAIAFLEWLREDNFIFFGMRMFSLSDNVSSKNLEDSTLGIFSNSHERLVWENIEKNEKCNNIEFFDCSEPVIVSMSNVKSTIHRSVYMVYISIKDFDFSGKLQGHLNVIGLFTSSVSTCSIMRIPYLQSKASAVITSLGFDSSDHSGKALANILETYPRDELFQISIPMLKKHCEIILNLVDRPRVRVLIRVDSLDRFVSVLVFVPRDRYSTVVRERIGIYLQKVFEGRLFSFYPFFPEETIARIHFIIGRCGGKTPKIKSSEIESFVNEIIRTWEDILYELAEKNQTELNLVQIVLNFSDSYRNNFSPKDALLDAERISQLGFSNPIDLFYYKNIAQKECEATLKIYYFGAPVSLSSRVPILENMGFRVISEYTFEVMNKELDPVFIHEMVIESNFYQPILLSSGGDLLLKDTFLSVWYKKSSNDKYNALTHTANLSSQDLSILRLFGRYFQQMRIPQSQGFIASVLNRYPEVAKHLHALFITRFDPSIMSRREETQKKIIKSIDEALDDIANIDDDAIIRRFVNLITSSLRTNYFSSSMKNSACSFAIKLNPALIHDLPEPRPWREIFVYGSEVEGVHLRFGPVSRGGLRWSDRAQDYRTEVLGLVKAQQIKNALIVPVGAKGGFYPKKLSSSTKDNFDKACLAYINFISSLLSLTDNLEDGRVVSPEGVVCHDEDDSYLVVAADKGTATFSDIANQISVKRGFWLSDAFASGGSEGYDHKKMAITAKGGWEAVKRHFRELMNFDIQTKSFRVCGIGDMSGDVFGNAMLLSKKIKLVAAFDHRDIFIDPNPDEEVSFMERERLFHLSRSSWQDYDRSKLSQGGMIFSRSCKSVHLTPEAMAFFGFVENEVTPSYILKAILKAEVDLIWFGGIGTYVKSSKEMDQEVGDHANDVVRVNACDLRAKVIGEGANLALTQSARIEFSLLGGACNSDAIDNSAGVNCSDVEVNIKIALADAMRQGLLTYSARNELLHRMTEEVSQLVLVNNYNQPLSISLFYRRGLLDMRHQERLIVALEQRGILNRLTEKLPSSVEMQERKLRNKPLVRPEISILLAYAKITLFSDILETNIPEDSYYDKDLIGYFPSQMQKKYKNSIDHHPLRREIISRVLVNKMIDHGGIDFIVDLQEVSGRPVGDIIRAFSIIYKGFDLDEIFLDIHTLDNRLNIKDQLDLYLSVQRFLRVTTAWELKNGDVFLPLEEQIINLRKARKYLEHRLSKLVSADEKEELDDSYEKLVQANVPPSLAQRISSLDVAKCIADIVLIARLTKISIIKVARNFFHVTNTLHIDKIEKAARALCVADSYEEMAIARSLDMINTAQRAIVVNLLLKFISCQDPLAAWMEAGGTVFASRYRHFQQLSEGGDMSLPRLMLIAAAINDFFPQQELR